MTTLPPGLPEDDFRAALTEFATAIGAENVYSEPDDVALYRDAYSPFWDEEGELLASAAVAPASTEEVSAIVKIANRFRIPLFAISTGKNLGYGGSAPNLSGSVIVDLKRMNRVIEVNDKRNFCIVEPGVSYFDLYDHIEANGLNVMMDIPDPGWGSPLGNALDHGVGYTMSVYRDHFGAHCGMEVVLPDGEIMRTGMGALPDAPTFAENKYGYGGYVDGLFAQSNFGIVTRMGFWMMPKPEHHLSCIVTVPNHADITPLCDIVNAMEDQFLIGHPRYFSPVDPMTLMIEPEIGAPLDVMELYQKSGGATVADLEAYVAEKGLGYWGVYLNFYGPKETCEANWAYAQRRIATIPGATFREAHDYALPLSEAEKEEYRHKVALGIPNMSVFSIGARQPMMPEPSDGHLWFSAIIPRSGEALIEAQEVFTKAVADLGLAPIVGVFTAPQTWNYRSWIFMVPFFVSRSDPQVNATARDSYRKLVEIGATHGWPEYRTAPAFQDLVAGTYSFNDHALLRFRTRLKDAIDPEGIIAPGRGGIWPRRYRGEQQ
jgi:4-cresol dehydrogenase (hydroxylating)